MRLRQVANLLDTDYLQTLHGKGFDVSSGERPRRPVERLVSVWGERQYQQRAARRDEAADMQHDRRPQPYGQGLGGVGLHHQVEVLAPLGRRVQQVGYSEVDRARREAPPRSVDRRT